MYGHCLGLLDRVAMVKSKPAGLQKRNSNVDHRLDDLRKRFESYAYDRTQHNFQLRIQKKDLHWLHGFCCFLKVRFHNGDKFEGKGVMLHPHHDMTSQLIQSGNSRFFAFHGQLCGMQLVLEASISAIGSMVSACIPGRMEPQKRDSILAADLRHIFLLFHEVNPTTSYSQLGVNCWVYHGIPPCWRM